MAIHITNKVLALLSNTNDFIVDVVGDNRDDRDNRLLDDTIGSDFVDHPNAMEDEENSEDDSTMEDEESSEDDSTMEDEESSEDEENEEIENIILIVDRAVGDTDPTNFPKTGDNASVSLRNSEYELFDRGFAERLKVEYPSIWAKGGNILGNTQYSRLTKILENNGKVETTTDEKAIRLREMWAARHFQDFRLAGVVAQIKWLVIGVKGERYMKDLINEEIAKMEMKKMNEDLKLEMRCVKHELLDGGSSRFELHGAKKRLGMSLHDIDVRAFDADDQEIDLDDTRALDGRGRPVKYYSIQGVASSTSVDSYGTEMSYKCLMSMQGQFQKGIPLLPRHSSRANGQMAEWDEVIGRTYDASLLQTDVVNAIDSSEKQYTLIVSSKLYGEDSLSRELVKRLRRGEPIGQSIGGWFDSVDVLENAQGEIERVIVQNVQLDHLAITRAPANPDSIGLMTYTKDSAELKNIISEWRSMNQEKSTNDMITVSKKETEDRHISYIEEDEETVTVVFEKTMGEYTKDQMKSKIKEMMSNDDTKEMMKEYMKEYLAEMLQEEIDANKMTFDNLANATNVEEIEDRDLDHSSVVESPIMNDDNVNGGEDEIVEPTTPETDSPMFDVERSVSSFHDDLPLAAEDVAWDWNTTTQDEILGKGLDNWERYAMAHLYKDDNANAETKGAYKLPIALMIDGELRVVWNGLVAVMGALNGARGGVDITEDDRQKVYIVLSKYYEKFEKEIPQLRAINKNDQKNHTIKNSVILSHEQPTIIEKGDTMNEDTMKMFADLIGRSVTQAIEPINSRLSEIESKKTDTVVVEERSTKKVEELQAIISKQNELLERALKEPQRMGVRVGQMHKGIGAVSAIESLTERAKKDGAVGLSAIVTRHIDAISEEKSMNDMSVHTIQNLLSAGLRAAEQDGLLGTIDQSWQ